VPFLSPPPLQLLQQKLAGEFEPELKLNTETKKIDQNNNKQFMKKFVSLSTK
jgi:hypothetical protein